MRKLFVSTSDAGLATGARAIRKLRAASLALYDVHWPDPDDLMTIGQSDAIRSRSDLLVGLRLEAQTRIDSAIDAVLDFQRAALTTTYGEGES